MKRLVVRLELVDAVLVGFAARVDRCDMRLNSVVHVFSFLALGRLLFFHIPRLRILR